MTGAAQGQGAAGAKRFTQYGAKVILSDILDEAGRDLAADLQMPYANLNVTNEAHWRSAVSQAVSTFGRLDILVNNAGVSHINHPAETTEAEFTRILQINTTGMFPGMKHVYPVMKSTGGSIVNIASIAALTGRAGLASYAASKWAVRRLSRPALLDFASDHIRVNTVFPGLIDTPVTRNAYGDQKMSERGHSLPVGRVGTPRDIANPVLFFA